MASGARVTIYLQEAVLERTDSYALHRGGISRSQAVSELLLRALASDLLELREDVIEKAIEASKADLEVRDGEW